MRHLVWLGLVGLGLVGCSKAPPSATKDAPLSSAEPTSANVEIKPAILTPPPPPAPPEPASLAGKTVLHVGDSMVGGNWGLTRALEGKLTHEGAKLVRHTKVSETVASFDKGTALRDLLARHHPDIVILTLGTNDVFVPYPQAYAANVASIAKKIAPRECWWIGPPTWKPDTGIVKVIQENAGDCKFFDSSALKLERGTDGIHPTDKGGADWAEKFWISFRAPSAAPSLGAPAAPTAPKDPTGALIAPAGASAPL